MSKPLSTLEKVDCIGQPSLNLRLIKTSDKSVKLHPYPSIVFSYYVHLSTIFVPRLNEFSWLVFIVLAVLVRGASGTYGLLLVVAVQAVEIPVKFRLPET